MKKKIKNHSKVAKAIKLTKKNNQLKQEKVTNKNLEKYRRQILDQAKKFKYPLQYEKHKLLINTVIIVMVSFLVLSGITYWSLYKANHTNDLLFKVTQVLPLPVGEIDQEKILYQDYLAYYRSSIHYYNNEQIKNKDDDIEVIKKRYKKKAMENAIKIAYAKKIAKENNLLVSDKEINQELKKKRTYADGMLSKSSFDNIIKKYYGLNKTEYKRIFIEYPLILKKVSLDVDIKAKKNLKKVIFLATEQKIEFQEIEKQMKGKIDFNDSGEVKYYNDDGGITKIANKLEVGEISKPIASRSLDSYSIIKLVSKNREYIRYQEIKIPLDEFNNSVDKMIKKHDYKIYIKL